MVIIFGRSPYINEIKEYIPELIKKHTTIGINYFCNTYPLNWAYLKGYKEVVLAGIDLILNTKHFDDNKICLSESSMETARNHLENVATKYLKIYQLNPNSNLKLPKIKMEDLLNGK